MSKPSHNHHEYCVLVIEMDLIPLVVAFIGTIVFGVEVGIHSVSTTHSSPLNFLMFGTLSPLPSMVFLLPASCTF